MCLSIRASEMHLIMRGPDLGVCATRRRPDGGAPQTCACAQVSKNTAHKGTPVSVTAKTPPFQCFTSNACANELNIQNWWYAAMTVKASLADAKAWSISPPRQHVSVVSQQRAVARSATRGCQRTVLHALEVNLRRGRPERATTV